MARPKWIFRSSLQAIEKDNGEVVQLPSELQGVILKRLVNAAPEAVRTEELLRLGWGHNTDQSRLRHVIMELRELFGDKATDDQWRYIDNVKGIGYRLTDAVMIEIATPRGVLPAEATGVFLGRDADLEAVRKALTPRNARIPLVVLDGMPGVGKSTISQAIAYDEELVAEFPDGILWTSLGEDPNVVKQMSEWGSFFDDDSILECATPNAARSRLSPLLRGKRLLLIVDDVWDVGDVIPFVKAPGDACAILVTTRMFTMGRALASENAVSMKLRPLSEGDGFALLKRLAGPVIDAHQSECRTLLRKVGYLPLAIHVAGLLLANEYEIDVEGAISGILENVHQKVLEGKPPVIMQTVDALQNAQKITINEVFAKSSRMLDVQDRQRFAVLGTYGRKTQLTTKELAGLWNMEDPLPTIRVLVGLGLLEPSGRGLFTLHELIAAHAATLDVHDSSGG